MKVCCDTCCKLSQNVVTNNNINNLLISDVVVDKLLVINIWQLNNMYITHKLEDVRKCVNFGTL